MNRARHCRRGFPGAPGTTPGPSWAVHWKAVTPGSPTLQTLPLTAAQASTETRPPAGQHRGLPRAHSTAARLTAMACLRRCHGAEAENSSASSTMCCSAEHRRPKHRVGPDTLSQRHEQGRELMRRPSNARVCVLLLHRQEGSASISAQPAEGKQAVLF